MSYSQTYRTLFELQVLHEYYLNDGPDSFRGMDPQQQGHGESKTASAC